MTAQIIDGKKIASEIKDQIAKKVQQRIKKKLPVPGLAVVLVGEDPASAIYVNSKHKACEKVGFYSKVIKLPKATSEKKLLEIVHQLNKDKKIHGILVQSPLPKKINFQHIIEAIDPKKDVDGFNPYNLGRLAQRHPTLRPCTPYGVMEMLKTTGVELKGKDVVIVGASTIVGLPMALEVLMEDATPTVCHIYTKNLAKKVKEVDIVIAAAGVPHLIKGNWVKKGAIVIDVGINRLPDGKIVGDVEFDKAKKNASWISPVPGGVGPMTIAMLLSNTLLAAKMLDQ